MDENNFEEWQSLKEQIKPEIPFRSTLAVQPGDDRNEEIRFKIELIPFEEDPYLRLTHDASGRAPGRTGTGQARSAADATNGDIALRGKYETLISNVPGVVYRCRFDSDWSMYFISDSIQEISGYPKEDFINNEVRTYASLIHPEDRQQVEEDVRQSVENDEIFELEYRILDSENQVHWVLERGQGIRNDDGDVICLEGVILDITERRLAKKRLQINEQRYRSVFENAEVGMAEISFDERWLNVNERLEEILGYSEEELLGMRCREITHPDSIEKDEKCTRKVMEGESDYYVTDKRYQQKNGDYIWVRMTVSRVDVPRGDHDGYFIAIIEDINDRKEYERELEEMVDERETLLKEIHHRVKNNLQMIISLLDMQRRQASTEEARKFIKESAGRIRSMALLHEMLYQEHRIAGIDLEDYVESLTAFIVQAHELKGREVNIDLDVDSTELALDQAIPSGLVLNELISNALEHGIGEANSIGVEVNFSIEDDRASIVVEDNGPGFPEDFEVNSSETLGLNLVKTLTEYELDGRLDIDSDQGARVEVSFSI